MNFIDPVYSSTNGNQPRTSKAWSNQPGPATKAHWESAAAPPRSISLASGNGDLAIGNGDLAIENGDLAIEHGDFPRLDMMTFQIIKLWSMEMLDLAIGNGDSGDFPDHKAMKSAWWIFADPSENCDSVKWDDIPFPTFPNSFWKI